MADDHPSGNKGRQLLASGLSIQYEVAVSSMEHRDHVVQQMTQSTFIDNLSTNLRENGVAVYVVSTTAEGAGLSD